MKVYAVSSYGTAVLNRRLALYSISSTVDRTESSSLSINVVLSETIQVFNKKSTKVESNFSETIYSLRVINIAFYWRNYTQSLTSRLGTLKG